ncbi:hypothetical protein J40TS1_42420 [Paenibacillus montaniterrae]|uniref:Uncharacterized protein n=1 Tax=Paenibacillus montaniterrae TaxID=429341 RepID=A0A919YRY6_9BACL|nr:hypothetical protein J40TS1_42420 [Paenibacillus montaniterrae]
MADRQQRLVNMPVRTEATGKAQGQDEISSIKALAAINALLTPQLRKQQLVIALS